MSDVRGLTRQATIPGAVLKHPVLVLAGLLAGLLLGVAASQLSAGSFQATAKIVVQDPRTGSDSAAAINLSPDRYVNEQLAIFALDTLAESAAEILNDELADASRRASAASARVDGDDGVLVGADDTIRLPATDPAITVGDDRSITFAAPGTPSVRADGTVLDSARTPVIDQFGDELVLQTTDAVVARDDGLLARVQAGGGVTVVEPPGRVLTLPAPGTPAPVDGGPSVESDGTVVIPFGDRAVEVAVESRPVVVDAAGQPLAVPGRSAFVGVDQRWLLLGDDGTAVAASDAETIVAAPDGEAVVLAPDSSVVAQTPGAVVDRFGELSTPTLELTGRDLSARLSVNAVEDSNLIEVHFTDGSAEVATMGANAVVDAYTELQSSDSASANAAALARADESIGRLTEELVAVERELTTARLSDPSRTELATQYDEVLAQISQAGRDLLAAPGQGAVAAQRIRDLLTQLDAIERVERLELSQPRIAEIVGRRDDVRARLTQLKAQRDTLSVDAERGANNVALASPAVSATALTGLGPSRLGFVGAVLGVFAAAGLAYVLELRRFTVESVDDVASTLQAPLLAEIPDFRHEKVKSRVPVLDYPSSYVAEAYRMTAAVVAISLEQGDGSVVGIVSAGVGDGKTTLAVNLAGALAQTERRVLAIDADLEGQVLSLTLRRYSGITPRARGLVDVIDKGMPLAEAVQPVPLGDESDLDLLSGGVGTSHVRTLIDSDEMQDMLQAARAAYEVTVVDVPPLLNVAYAAHVLRGLDAAVVVVAAGSSLRSLLEVRDRLEFLGVRVLGFVYNRAPLRPERTASLSALHHDLGGRSTNRTRWAKRRLRQQARTNGAVAPSPRPAAGERRSGGG